MVVPLAISRQPVCPRRSRSVTAPPPLPSVHNERFDVLPPADVFPDHGDIEGSRIAEAAREDIDGLPIKNHFRLRALGLIDSKGRPEPVPQLLESRGVVLGDAAALVGRDVEEELGVAADRGVIDVEELIQRLDLVVLSGVVEPAGPDGDVDLPRIPDEASALTGDLGDPLHGAEVFGLGVEAGDPAGILLVGQVVEAGDGDDAPFALARHARFVPDPAGVRPHDRDDGPGLEPADEREIPRPVVDLPPAVRSLAAGAVEPDLGDLAVVRQELAELVLEMLVVAGRVAVARLVPVPGREVDAERKPAFAAGRGDLADDVALPVLPRRAPDRVLGEFARPQAEAVVVLGREDQTPDPRGLDRLDPLVRRRGPSGSKSFGSSVPSPHSRSVKVFMPKWTKAWNSSACQAI